MACCWSTAARRHWLPAVQKSLAGASVRTLFNTHYHADQTGGNALFAKAGAEIHAHTITRQWLAADYYVPAEDRWVKAPPKEAVPTVTFRGRGEMKAGAETIEFGYLLEAHTRGDAYVFFRDSNVLAAGDVVSPLRDPALDWYAGGWLGGRADAMDDLLELVNDQTRDRAGLRPGDDARRAAGRARHDGEALRPHRGADPQGPQRARTC